MADSAPRIARSTEEAIAHAAFSFSGENLVPGPSDNPSSAHALFEHFSLEGRRNVSDETVVLHQGDLEKLLRTSHSGVALPSVLFLDERRVLDYLPSLYHAAREGNHKVVLHLRRRHILPLASLTDLGFIVFFSARGRDAYATALLAHLVAARYKKTRSPILRRKRSLTKYFSALMVGKASLCCTSGMKAINK